MSPKPSSQKDQQNSQPSDRAMMARRRQQKAAERQAADAEEVQQGPAAVQPAAEASAADGAVAAEASPLQAPGLEMIGQEMVLASQALVPAPNTSAATEKALRTPVREAEGGQPSSQSTELQPASIQNYNQSPVPNGSDQEPRDRKTSGVKQSEQGSLQTPVGAPVSYGPTDQTARSLLPLFTAEQVQQMQALERSAPLLASPGNYGAAPEQGRGFLDPGAGAGGLAGLIPQVLDPVRQALMASMQSSLSSLVGGGHLRPPGLYPHALPGIDSAHRDGTDPRSAEWSWKMQMEHQMELLGLELRASHSENQRLRTEIKDLLQKKESSTYGTPEGEVGRSRRLEIEDGRVPTRSDWGRASWPASRSGWASRPASRSGWASRPASRSGWASWPASRSGRASRPASRSGRARRPARKTGWARKPTSKTGWASWPARDKKWSR